jgi:hypothetical protein
MDPEVEYSWDRKHAGDAFKTTVADIYLGPDATLLSLFASALLTYFGAVEAPRSPSMICWRPPQSLTMRSGPRPPTTATFRWLRRRI